MGFFNFWKKKAEILTLEKLVEKFDELKEELKQLREEKKQEVEKKPSKIGILFTPNKELKLVVDGVEYLSGDTTIEFYKELGVLFDNGDIDEVVRRVQNTITLPKKYIDEEDEEIEKVISNTFSLLKANNDFEVRENSVFLKGINRSLPQAMVNKFLSILENVGTDDSEEQYNAWKNYWYWVVTNPNIEAITGFYDIMEKYNVQVSKEGIILAYRWVKLYNGGKNRELLEFISREWARVKKNKKSPKNYNVVEIVTYTEEEGHFEESEEEYDEFGEPYETDEEWVVDVEASSTSEFQIVKTDKDIENGEIMGNLDTLHSHLEDVSETVYTDGYTGEFRIKIGEEVKMNREDCDESSDSCSKGLHNCFRLSDHSGDCIHNIKILTAICPRDIVSVPREKSKFRSCRYMPLAVLGKDDNENFIVNGEGLDILEKYTTFKLDELKKEAEENTVEELEANYLIPKMETQELNSAIDYLSERVVQVS